MTKAKCCARSLPTSPERAVMSMKPFEMISLSDAGTEQFTAPHRQIESTVDAQQGFHKHKLAEKLHDEADEALPEGILLVKPCLALGEENGDSNKSLLALTTKLSTINMMDARIEDPCSQISGFRTKNTLGFKKLKVHFEKPLT